MRRISTALIVLMTVAAASCADPATRVIKRPDLKIEDSGVVRQITYQHLERPSIKKIRSEYLVKQWFENNRDRKSCELHFAVIHNPNSSLIDASKSEISITWRQHDSDIMFDKFVVVQHPDIYLPEGDLSQLGTWRRRGDEPAERADQGIQSRWLW